MTPRERFLSLLKHDILKLDLAELNFGIYRILNARRDLVLRYLDEELPAFISGQLATLPGTATEDEEGRIYAALDTFFHRYWRSLLSNPKASSLSSAMRASKPNWICCKSLKH